MPNWCHNLLEVSGLEVEEFVKRVKGLPQIYKTENIEEFIEEILSFHQIVPIPPDILASHYDSVAENTELFLWGCKWGATETSFSKIQEVVIYKFFTPWNPPKKFLLQASKLFLCKFTLKYAEFAISFAGEYICQYGKEIKDLNWRVDQSDRELFKLEHSLLNN